MTQFHLFGAATGSGESFRIQTCSEFPDCQLFPYSRRPRELGLGFHHVDFNLPDIFHPAGVPSDPSVWISFGPIWLFAPFFERLASSHPERLANLVGLIACSSSSVLTKRFASNSFDRKLVARLEHAESQLLSICRRFGIGCRIRLILVFASRYTLLNSRQLLCALLGR